MTPWRCTLPHFALLAAICVACGGRFEQDRSGEGGAGAGGVSGEGGTSGRGGSGAEAGLSLGGWPAGCYHNGAYYKQGTTFPAGDGCNSCSCDLGQVDCTLSGCALCSVNGLVYKPGDAFPAGDGCNSCSCDASGAVSCTELGCGRTCAELEAAYERAVGLAKTCNRALRGPTCVALSSVGLQCGCDSHLDEKNKPAINSLALIAEKYAESGCANKPVSCRPCAEPGHGYCTNDGHCIDSNALGGP